MYILPIKPEHRAELKYLKDEMDHLNRIGSRDKTQAAINKIAKRSLELYPELKGKRSLFEENCLHLMVYETREEWLVAIFGSVKATGEAPWVATPRNAELDDYDFLGPAKS